MAITMARTPILDYDRQCIAPRVCAAVVLSLAIRKIGRPAISLTDSLPAIASGASLAAPGSLPVAVFKT